MAKRRSVEFRNLQKMEKKGFRGYPAATIALYGPDNKRASKIAVGILKDPRHDIDELERWFSEEIDIRMNKEVLDEILEFIKSRNVKSVVTPDRIIGCPHEEGKDYPEGEYCPVCPYWKNRDHMTGEIMH